MSFQAMTWAVDHELPAMQKIVLMMMSNRFNEDHGYCWPSHDLLAKECGMDKRSVIRQIDKLQDAGLVTSVKTKLNNGLNGGNKYKLNMSVVGNLKLERDRKNSSVTESLPSDRKSCASDRESFSVVTESHVLVTESHSKQLNKTIKQEPINSEPVNGANAQSQKTEKQKPEKQVKAKITTDWMPSKRCLELIENAGIDVNFALSLVGEFVLYWDERGDKRNGWDATFLGFVKRENERKRPQYSQKPYQQKQQAQRPIYEYTPSSYDFDSMRTIDGEVI